MRKDAPGHAHGFSLVELLSVVAIAAILTGLALPGFQDTLRRQRASSTMPLLVGQLAQARNPAISRQIPVTVCPSRGDGRCRSDPDWSAGWLAYHDPLRSDQPRSRADILREEHRPADGPVRILGSAGRLRVRYQPSGRSGGTNLTLRICAGAALQGEVIVNNVGRARSRRVQGACPS
ncbi:GspH/FimT family pseudopilin [Pseudoxanthomonas koreensis]|uniref:GspH/FimT family pseudopilin n=1 Tax=Pseudoxanthomonas koreensis TaxID=266061 RepID=UPI0013910563|nr:Tfp pilus assembly protein FimT/FimU [Pseudoxanthomonas koreensis]KAF1691376.1 pilus assembly protein [Pseudoxanthomonas koreensis]